MTRKKPYQDPETLVQLYHEDMKSMSDIADEFGVSERTISKWMDKHEIPRRSRSEAAQNRYIPVKKRFWEKVDKDDPDECWEWQAGQTVFGYGKFWKDGRNVNAHRIAYQLEKGDVDDGWVLHHCDNPPCVNPNHLYLGTPSDNLRDAISRGRKELPNNSGENHPQSKLTERQVIEIRQRVCDDGVSQGELAGEFGVSRTTISAIANNATWGDV